VLLVPFLSILAAGMIARAATGGFEWLYSVRLLAAVAALWFFRRSYSQFNWSCGILAPITGLVVFLVWIAADRAMNPAIPIPTALAGASAWVRDGWIGLRILGAVFTVPIAEELAFRGYLLRRFTGANFDSIPFPSTSWVAVVGSSVLFGCMHGGHWWLGTLAGLAYSVLLRKTGRMGDAVVAHAVTNALLAVCVLAFGQWQLW
jgi:CAAX prenyl protease-like protein